jgi:hypothetical protein
MITLDGYSRNGSLFRQEFLTYGQCKPQATERQDRHDTATRTDRTSARAQQFERVRELSDASVPFPYDVHSAYSSSDATTLENQLHKAFTRRRVNIVNERREFFFATPMEVREALQEKTGGLLELAEQPQANQYFQSNG